MSEDEKKVPAPVEPEGHRPPSGDSAYGGSPPPTSSKPPKADKPKAAPKGPHYPGVPPYPEPAVLAARVARAAAAVLTADPPPDEPKFPTSTGYGGEWATPGLHSSEEMCLCGGDKKVRSRQPNAVMESKHTKIPHPPNEGRKTVARALDRLRAGLIEGKLDLSSTPLKASDLEAMAFILPNAQRVHELNFNSCHLLGDAGAHALAALLEAAPHVTAVWARGCNFGEAGGQALLSIIEGSCESGGGPTLALELLDLDENVKIRYATRAEISRKCAYNGNRCRRVKMSSLVPSTVPGVPVGGLATGHLGKPLPPRPQADPRPWRRRSGVQPMQADEATRQRELEARRAESLLTQRRKHEKKEFMPVAEAVRAERQRREEADRAAAAAAELAAEERKQLWARKQVEWAASAAARLAAAPVKAKAPVANPYAPVVLTAPNAQPAVTLEEADVGAARAGAYPNFPDRGAKWLWSAAPGRGPPAPMHEDVVFQRTYKNGTGAPVSATLHAVLEGGSRVFFGQRQLLPGGCTIMPVGGLKPHYGQYPVSIPPGEHLFEFVCKPCASGPPGLLYSLLDAGRSMLANSGGKETLFVPPPPPAAAAAAHVHAT